MYEVTEPKATTKPVEEDDDSEGDAILAELEAETEDTSSELYHNRMNQLQSNISSSTAKGLSGVSLSQRNSYITLKSDDETLRFTTEHETAVVHFRHPDFARCSVMDDHLDRIAQSHSLGEAGGEEAAFAAVDVANAPFVVEKLGVKVLPCVIGFAKGIVKGKVIGFEGICWDGREKDVRVSMALERSLLSWGVIQQKMLSDDVENDSDEHSKDEKERSTGTTGRRGIKAAKHRVDDDDDWD